MIRSGLPNGIGSHPTFRAAGFLAGVTGAASVFVPFLNGVTAALAALAVSIWLMRWADERRGRTADGCSPQRYRGIAAVIVGWALFGGLLMRHWPGPGLLLGISMLTLTWLEPKAMSLNEGG